MASDDGSRPTKLTHLCPHCGLSGIHPIVIGGDDGAEHEIEPVDEKLRKKICELEREVGRLTGRAVEQADKLADAEDELRQLRAQSPSSTAATTPQNTPPQPPPRRPTISRKPVANAALNASATKLSSLTAEDSRPKTAPGDITLSPTATTPTGENASSPSLTTAGQLQSTLRRATSLRFSNFLRKPSTDAPPVPTLDPAAALESEAQRRIAAETKLTQVNTELEDLSATLFQQANEMVATERRLRAETETRYEARAKGQEVRIQRLEERIKVLEERDKERGRRLEALEKGMRRVGRVRGMLGR